METVSLSLDLAKNGLPVIKQDQIEVVKDPRILIAIPAYGGKIDGAFSSCLMTARLSLPIIGHIEFLSGDSLVNRARNNLAFQFLQGQKAKLHGIKEVVLHFEWLLFLDADLVFNPDDIQRLYELGVSRGPGVYCGMYAIKKLKPQVVFNQMPGCKPDENGVVQVRESGTGFMLIHRTVFETMRDKLPEIEFEADSGDLAAVRTKKWDFFTVGVKLDSFFKHRRFLSEDWFFCQRWNDLGGKVFLHTKIQCGHIGQFCYPADPQEIIEVAEIYKNSLTADQLNVIKNKDVPKGAIYSESATDHSASVTV